MMMKMLSLATLFFLLTFSLAIAHHPAADMVDADIYAMIDDMVSDTPHGDLVFDEEMGTTTISEITVEDADDLIRDGLLDAASVLDDDVTITITFPEEEPALLMSIEKLSQGTGQNSNGKKWSEWDRPVQITIQQTAK